MTAECTLCLRRWAEHRANGVLVVDPRTDGPARHLDDSACPASPPGPSP
ncbi:hypothetical protein NKH18_46310 [Streptomyces sp. M10(2022)]